MPNSMTPRCLSWLLRTLLGLPFGLLAVHAAAAGAGLVPAHHVSLHGSGGDEQVAQRNIRDTHQACVMARKLNNQPWVPLPPELPIISRAVDVDAYYADNRVMHVVRGENKKIDLSDCSLQTHRWHIAKLVSMAGGCEIDLLNNKKKGVCDAAQHAAAGPRPVSRPGGGRVRLPNPRTVAGELCHVYRHGPIEHCIAELTPEDGRRYAPASAYPGPDNAGLHGLLLESKVPGIGELKATRVELNLMVPASVFSADFTGSPGP